MAKKMPFGSSLLFPKATPVCCANISISDKSGSRVTSTFLHGPAHLLNHNSPSNLRMKMCTEATGLHYLVTLEEEDGFPKYAELTWDYFTGQKNVGVEISFAFWSSNACSEDFNRKVVAVLCFPCVGCLLRLHGEDG